MAQPLIDTTSGFSKIGRFNTSSRFFIIAGLVLLLASCDRPSGDLSDEALRNASYASDSFEGLTVRLQNGHYRGHFATDESMEFEVGMLPDVARGTLDGHEAAVVVLFSNSGGTGTFIDLAVVTIVDGKPSNIATMNLGDRVKINRTAIAQDTIIVDMLAHGPDDALCCPSLPVVRKFTLRGSLLQEARPDVEDNP